MQQFNDLPRDTQLTSEEVGHGLKSSDFWSIYAFH